MSGQARRWLLGLIVAAAVVASCRSLSRRSACGEDGDLALDVAAMGAAVQEWLADVGPMTADSTPIRVLDAGAEPRRPLRLHPPIGLRQTIVSTMEVSVEVSGVLPVESGAPFRRQNALPMTKSTSTYIVLDVNPEADIRYRTEFDPIETVGWNDDPTFAALLQGMGAAARPEPMETTITPWKAVRRGGIPAVPDAGTPFGFMEQFTGSVMGPMMEATAWPEEPLGVGARWESAFRLSAGGMIFSATALSEMTAFEGDHVRIESRMTGSLDGTSDLVGAAGAEMLESAVSAVVVEEYDLSLLGCLESHGEVTFASTTRITRDGRSMDMTQTAGMTMVTFDADRRPRALPEDGG